MSAHENHGAGHEHHNPIPKYIGIFILLSLVTAFEALPLFGLLQIPAALLLGLSAVKFAIVVLIFMHLLGDHPMFWWVFWIPLGMVFVTVGVLMGLFNTWTLSYDQIPVHDSKGAGVVCEKVGEGAEAKEHCYAKDLKLVSSCYSSRFEGDCASWITSPITGNLYCGAPVHKGEDCVTLTPDMATAAAYAEKKAAAYPQFEGFEGKSADEKKAALMEVGKEVYGGKCSACHGAEGAGAPGVFPPLANDPVANGGSPDEHISIILKGLSGKTINGVAYAAAMQPWAMLSDEEIAAVVTYERNSWGNNGGVVMPEDVKKKR